jgi:predicted metal-dependent hydrolase
MATASSGVVVIGGREIRYRVRTSARASRLSLRIDPQEGLEVIVPLRVRDADIGRLVAAKSGWVARKLRDIARQKAATPGIELRDGAEIMLLGRTHALHVSTADGRRAWIERLPGHIHLRIDSLDDDRVGAAFRWWLVRLAKAAIPERVEALNARCGMTYSRISIRSQRTRWGSCSRRGTLSFNWRLVLLPPEVMDYLIYHELAHIQQMNHSRRFWKVVERWCPGYREAERWLRQHGPYLIV